MNELTALVVTYFCLGVLYGAAGLGYYKLLKNGGYKMVFRKKTTVKNQTKEYVDGQEVPREVPELNVPLPSKAEQKEVPQLNAEEVYAEGRSVGFQEGMIYALELLQDHLHRHQEDLRKKLGQVQK